MQKVLLKVLLNEEIINCNRCPRLIKHCKTVAVEKRKSYQTESYWGKPVPNFGDAKSQILIVGLAPAAHGANRTGRMFTGDRSGDWLYRSLHKFSLANQAHSTHMDDGLKLNNVLITAVAHCAPPDNKPSLKEILNCKVFLQNTMDETPFRVIIALGGIAWKATIKELRENDLLAEDEKKFTHGQSLKIKDNRLLIASYHPSQQNTFTGRLTEKMFDSVFETAQRFLHT